MYKPSYYNVTTKADDNGHLIYNMVTRALIYLKNVHFKKCTFLFDEKHSIPSDHEAIRSLSEVGCIVPKDFDELKYFENKFKESISQTKLLAFTIIPTLDCNFKCKYCYQVRRKSEISRNVLSNIEKTIRIKLNEGKVRTIHIDWIGGEPLLEKDKILFFQNRIQKLCSKFDVKFYSSISTNGYLLSKKTIDDLFTAGIKKVNVTLAGDLKNHNLVRSHNKNTDSFQTVYSNLQKIDSRFTLMLNIDVSAKNYLSIPTLLEHIKANSIQAKYAINFNRIESFSANPCGELEMSIPEFMQIYFNLLRKVFRCGLPMANNSRFGVNSYSYCGVQLKNNFIVNWDGKTYKCSEFGKLHENSIGNIDKNGFLHFESKELKKWQFNPFHHEQCRNCNILPYCFGGCSQKRNRGKNFCPEEKEYLPELLKFYYLYIQQKDINCQSQKFLQNETI